MQPPENVYIVYPHWTIREVKGLRNHFVVVATMRWGVTETGNALLEPEQARALRRALARKRGMVAPAIPLLHKALGWRLDMMPPPGSEAPSLANREPHSPALLYGQTGMVDQNPAPPLSPEDWAAGPQPRKAAPLALAPLKPVMPKLATPLSAPAPPQLPDLADLKPDTPLTLAEACRLVFRDHIKPATLRAEARRGNLVIERIGRRDFVTLAAVEEMRARCRIGLA